MIHNYTEGQQVTISPISTRLKPALVAMTSSARSSCSRIHSPRVVSLPDSLDYSGFQSIMVAWTGNSMGWSSNMRRISWLPSTCCD